MSVYLNFWRLQFIPDRPVVNAKNLHFISKYQTFFGLYKNRLLWKTRGKWRWPMNSFIMLPVAHFLGSKGPTAPFSFTRSAMFFRGCNCGFCGSLRPCVLRVWASQSQSRWVCGSWLTQIVIWRRKSPWGTPGQNSSTRLPSQHNKVCHGALSAMLSMCHDTPFAPTFLLRRKPP